MSKAKDPFHDVKVMFDLRPYLGLEAVARPLGLTQRAAAHRYLLDELPGLGGGFPNDLRPPVTSDHFAGGTVRSVGGALGRGGVGLRWRGLAMALSSLVLMLGLATGAAAQTCATTDVAITGVTPAPSDPAALAGDCTALLGLKDTLRGMGTLNWANTLSMDSWNGITLSANANRVRGIRLTSQGLDGSIPDLSALTSLQWLQLGGNQLTGSIPDLSALASLQSLILHEPTN